MSRVCPSVIVGVLCMVCDPEHVVTTPGKLPRKEGVVIGGKALSSEHKAKISAKLTRHAEFDLPDCKCYAHDRPMFVSNLSKRMIDLLLFEFPEVVAEKQFGRFRVDAYLPPPYHLAFEADGSYWHNLPGRKEKDIARDAWLLEHFNLPVVRVLQEGLDAVS